MNNLIHDTLISLLMKLTQVYSLSLGELILAYEDQFTEDKKGIELLKQYNSKGKIDNTFAELIIKHLQK